MFGSSHHDTHAQAAARAAKVAFYLGVVADIAGSSDEGYRVKPDSPLVPGFTGESPYKGK